MRGRPLSSAATLSVPAADDNVRSAFAFPPWRRKVSFQSSSEMSNGAAASVKKMSSAQVALVATVRTLAYGVGEYDEGIILTNAKLLGWGFVPYRDFYSNYPPGIFLTVAALWKLVGVRVLALRGLGLLIHLLLALLALLPLVLTACGKGGGGY